MADRYNVAKAHAAPIFRAEVSFAGIIVHNIGRGRQVMGILVNELPREGVVLSLLPIRQTVVSHPRGL